MGGGIRTNVKGYILKRHTLAVDTENGNENETINNSLTVPQAADCVDIAGPGPYPSSFPEASGGANRAIQCLQMLRFALCFKGTTDLEGVKIARGIPPSTFLKVVLKLDLHDKKRREKSFKCLFLMHGLDSIALYRKHTQMTLIGYVDPVYVVSALRRYCDTELLAVGRTETNTVGALSETRSVLEPQEE